MATRMRWEREKGISKSYALMDEHSHHELAHLVYASTTSTYTLSYGNRRIALKLYSLGTKIAISDVNIGVDLGTISCTFRGFYSIPNLVEWKDGGCLYLPPPSVVQPTTKSGLIYSLVPKDEKGRRLMRMEWTPKPGNILPSYSGSREWERCEVIPEDLSVNDPEFHLISGIGWMTILQLIWLDKMFI